MDIPHNVACRILGQNSVLMVVASLLLLDLFILLANPDAACMYSLVTLLVSTWLAVRVKVA